jgi:predicted nucleic acid-binding protein
VTANRVVDTSVLIAHLRGDGRITARLRDELLLGRAWFTSSVSHYELYRAARPGEAQGVRQLLERAWTIPVTTAVAREAAHIWAELRQDGYTIDIPDPFIAASARLHGLGVATLNGRHFRLGRGLTVEEP